MRWMIGKYMRFLPLTEQPDTYSAKDLCYKDDEYIFEFHADAYLLNPESVVRFVFLGCSVFLSSARLFNFSPELFFSRHPLR